MYEWDTTTFELTEACVQLKNGLRFSIQHSRHGRWYMLEDDSRGTFYRVGPAEYTFLSLLDGNTTIATAMAATCSRMGGNALTEQDAIGLCKWLIESGLAKTEASVSARRIGQQQEQTAQRKFMQRLNPISIRFALWNPDHVVTNVTRWVGWMISWPMALAWIFVCTYALIAVLMDWDRLVQGGVQVFTRDGLFWMAASWLVLKLIHELAHAVACKQFGGRIGDCGFLLLLLIPLPFVDVTSAWRFTNKYQRILVSAAGMLAEIFIAAIAAIVWCNSGPGIVSTVAASMIFAASLHTLLFNANPLMKFDGYHILADWLEIPNLGSHGQRYVTGIARRVFLGQPTEPVKFAGFHGQLIRFYGVAALLWRILLCLVLTLAAASLLHGIGLLIALMAGVLWLGLPVYNFTRYMISGNDFDQPDRVRFARVTATLLAVLLLAALVCPAPSVITAPAVIEYADLQVLRNESAGFVQSIEVEPDQLVEQGELLLVLSNPDLETELASTQWRLKQARIRAAASQSAGHISQLQIEQEAVTSLEKQLAELSNAAESLSIRAPSAGRVIANDLSSLAGQFIYAGTELLSIGDDTKKRATALVAQDDARHLTQVHDKPAHVRIWGRHGVEPARISEVSPRGQVDLPHFAFAGMYGGPLHVVDRQQMGGEGITADEQLILVNARVKVSVKFDANSSQRLMAGQTGQLHLRGRTRMLGAYVLDEFRRWIGSHLKLNHGL
ncbi:MAG: HlyD family efflux transporter periplasmic adaptor subunit [Pirellulaceae bacterium]